MNNKKSSPWKSIRLGFIILLIFVIYAYGFDVTAVTLEELKSETRQESLTRVTRALAKPEIIEYEQTVEVVNAPVYVSCPQGGVTLPEPDTSGPYIVVSPACAEAGEPVTVQGFNFAPNTEGPLRFIPGNDPANIVELGRDNVRTDGDGNFVAEFTLPKGRASDDVQYIRATLSANVGTPRFTQTAKDTWNKIIETVFLALLATTVGTILAIPISFIAARNLMKSVRSPLTSIAFSTLGWPIGMALGIYIVGLVGDFSGPLTGNLLLNIVIVGVLPVAIPVAIRWSLPQEEISTPGPALRTGRMAVILLTVLVSFFGLYQLSGLFRNGGLVLENILGAWGFLGSFLFQLGDILGVLIPVTAALAAGGALSSFLGRIGQRAAEKLPAATVKLLNLIFSALAGATVLGLIGWLVEWLYQIGRPEFTLWGPVTVGAALGLLLAVFSKAKDSLPIGLVIYTVTRTILNTLRSVEALVMAIVFVIAVGIGPFAGVMALGLHTIVSLAKLYSEQVESIQAGPLEAVQATGANRLQTIIYAVVPQIVPPYISYTMYRWDINVRMSTIIGFVGGGGIGFLLQQNINLLNYRAASAQMIAIAVVVSIMDYVSSALREKVV